MSCAGSWGWGRASSTSAAVQPIWKSCSGGRDEPGRFLETLRRHFTSPAYLVFVGVITIVSSIAGATNSGAGMWQAFWSLLTIGIGAQLIGPEFSSGTLQ